MNVDRKWIIVEPSMVGNSGIISNQAPWTNNNFINLSRLLNAKRYHITSSELYQDSADAYYLISCIDTNMEHELAFIDHAHSRGAKVVLAISIDGRFLSGHGLFSYTTGIIYTELCKKVDAIISGIPININMYGKYQNKVVELGEFVEELNFSILPYDQRSINLLSAGSPDECTFSFSVVLFEMLKEKYPSHRFIHSFRSDPSYTNTINLIRDKCPFLELSQEPFYHLLKHSKGFVNLEVRPRFGRIILEAWYHRVPSISSSNVYFSKLFPDFNYSYIDFAKIIECYDKMVEYNYEETMRKAEKILEYDYAQNSYNRVCQMLDKGII